MMYGNRVVWSKDVARSWHDDVSTVFIEGTAYLFRYFSVDERPTIGAPFSENPTMRILSTPIPTTHNSSINMAQARVLTFFASMLDASGECLTVSQPVRKATDGVSDSDDEQLPNPAITPAFSERELWYVQEHYEQLHSTFTSAVEHHFTNAAGKLFFKSLVEFLLLLRPNKQHYRLYHSTNLHGVRQPGSSEITHTVPKRNTRQAETNGQSSSTIERVADFVVFDHTTQMYTMHCWGDKE